MCPKRSLQRPQRRIQHDSAHHTALHSLCGRAVGEPQREKKADLFFSRFEAILLDICCVVLSCAGSEPATENQAVFTRVSMCTSPNASSISFGTVALDSTRVDSWPTALVVASAFHAVTLHHPSRYFLQWPACKRSRDERRSMSCVPTGSTTWCCLPPWSPSERGKTFKSVTTAHPAQSCHCLLSFVSVVVYLSCLVVWLLAQVMRLFVCSTSCPSCMFWSKGVGVVLSHLPVSLFRARIDEQGSRSTEADHTLCPFRALMFSLAVYPMCVITMGTWQSPLARPCCWIRAFRGRPHLQARRFLRLRLFTSKTSYRTTRHS